MRAFLAIFTLLAGLFALACGAKPLSAAAANIVSVRNPSELQNCESLGKINADVSFSSGLGSSGAGDDKETRINNELREKTAQKGGTHVLLKKDALGISTDQEGEAFKCAPSADKATAPTGSAP